MASGRRPGEFPYDAGIHPSGYLTKRWTIRQLAGTFSPTSTNERFKYLLGLGETGLSLAFDLPTQLGLDPDDPNAMGEVGRTGVSIATIDDLSTVFDGIRLDQVSVSFTINATAPMLLAMWIVVAEEQGLDPRVLRGTLQNEMLKEFLARKAYIFDIDTSMRYSVDVIEHCARYLPGVNHVSISGGHAREAGASRSLEVACALADAEAYLSCAAARGLDLNVIGQKMSFIFGSHMELLAEAAKFRVARRLFAQRMATIFGVTEPRAMKMRIQANTFGSALAYQEPLNNIARTTVQAIAAILGGVQSLHVCSFDEAHQTPGWLGARIALRTQQILAEETDLTRHVDPLGGSVVIDSIAAELECEVEDWLRRIGERGGMVDCIRSGWLEAEIETLAVTANMPSAGVHDEMVSESEKRLIDEERLGRSVKDERALVVHRACAEELARLSADAKAGRNVLPALVEAARARATIGEMRVAMTPGAVGAAASSGKE